MDIITLWCNGLGFGIVMLILLIITIGLCICIRPCQETDYAYNQIYGESETCKTYIRCIILGVILLGMLLIFIVQYLQCHQH